MDWLIDVADIILSAIPGGFAHLVSQADVFLSAIPNLFGGLPAWLYGLVGAGSLGSTYLLLFCREEDED